MSVRRVVHGGGIEEAVIENADCAVSLLNLGCALRDWRVPHGGRAVPVTLGYANPAAYRDNPFYLGVIVGWVANRIAHGRLRFGDRVVRLPVNAPPHHLHGGPEGLSTRLWAMETDGRADTVRFVHDSPDGAGGWPGAVRFTVEAALCGRELVWRMRARPDRPTPVNLALHAYWNLDGGRDVRDHALGVAAGRVARTDATLAPTGEIAPVDGTRFDFRAGRGLREADPDALGYDATLALDGGPEPAAALGAPGGLRLRLWTDRPSLQLFDAKPFDPADFAATRRGHDGAAYGPFAGLALEAQDFPDAPNRPEFPSILCDPERPYSQRLKLEVGPG